MFGHLKTKMVAKWITVRIRAKSESPPVGGLSVRSTSRQGKSYLAVAVPSVDAESSAPSTVVDIGSAVNH